jgi:hypothetical protein
VRIESRKSQKKLNMDEEETDTASIGDPDSVTDGRRGHKRMRTEYEQDDVYNFAESKLKKIKDNNSGDKSQFEISDIFKLGGSTMMRVITKEKNKCMTVDLFPEKFFNENALKISQTYQTKEAANNVRQRIVALYNYILRDGPDVWLDNPEFNPKTLYAPNKYVDVLTAVLTVCARRSPRLTSNDFRGLANQLVEDYEGLTIHDLIQEAKLSTLLPIGTRSPIGNIAKNNICQKKGIIHAEFDEQHVKVPVEYSRHMFLKYRMDEIDSVKEAIMEVALLQWKK